MLGNTNAQRIQLKKTFCSKMLKINLEDDIEQKVFLSSMRCALGFPNIKSSIARSAPAPQAKRHAARCAAEASDRSNLPAHLVLLEHFECVGSAELRTVWWRRDAVLEVNITKPVPLVLISPFHQVLCAAQLPVGAQRERMKGGREKERESGKVPFFSLFKFLHALASGLSQYRETR